MPQRTCKPLQSIRAVDHHRSRDQRQLLFSTRLRWHVQAAFNRKARSWSAPFRVYGLCHCWLFFIEKLAACAFCIISSMSDVPHNLHKIYIWIACETAAICSGKFSSGKGGNSSLYKTEKARCVRICDQKGFWSLKHAAWLICRLRLWLWIVALLALFAPGL